MKQRSYHSPQPVLAYYAQIEHQYPTIAHVARRYLCIPSSNVASESLWSMAGYTAGDQRSKTSPELLEAQLMVRRNAEECKVVKELLGL